jgi:hypothetical protein
MKYWISVAIVPLSVISTADSARAASADDFTLAFSPENQWMHESGETADFAIVLKTRVAGTQGWSFGVMLGADPEVDASITSLEVGDALRTIQNGKGPDFQVMQWYESGNLNTPAGTCDPACLTLPLAVGFTQQVLIDDRELITLPARPDGIAVAQVAVSAASTSGGRAWLSFADSLGQPDVPTGVLHEGRSIALDRRARGVLHFPGEGTYDLLLQPAYSEFYFPPSVAGSASVDLDVVLKTRVDGTQGWSLGAIVWADADVRAQITSLRVDPTLETIFDGNPPSFVSLYGVVVGNNDSQTPCDSVDCTGLASNAFAMAVARPLFPYFATLDANPQGIRVANLTLHAEVNAPFLGHKEVIIEFCDSVPRFDPVTHDVLPPYPTRVVSGDNRSITPAVQGSTVIWFLPLSTPSFLRGDANTDGDMNMADAIYLLQYLFAEGPAVRCPDAGDANDDESMNLADGIYILQYLFADGPAIPPPHLRCGTDQTNHPDGGPELGACEYPAAQCSDTGT